MMHIKHFSFDLWATLIKSNPAFKKERALYFHRRFNTFNKPVEEVESVFRSIDLMCNAINEQTGKNIDAEEMYLMVIYQLNHSLVAFEHIDTQALYKDMENLIFQYPPVIFTSQTHACLDKIKENATKTLNILSNTAFVKGSTLRQIVNHLELSKYFDFQLYSDEAGVSKPNKEIFNLMLDSVYSIWKKEDISLDEIVHVGDNPVADIFGATAVGIRAFQINSNSKLITNLFN